MFKKKFGKNTFHVVVLSFFAALSKVTWDHIGPWTLLAIGAYLLIGHIIAEKSVDVWFRAAYQPTCFLLFPLGTIVAYNGKQGHLDHKEMFKFDKNWRRIFFTRPLLGIRHVLDKIPPTYGNDQRALAQKKYVNWTTLFWPIRLVWNVPIMLMMAVITSAFAIALMDMHRLRFVVRTYAPPVPSFFKSS